MKFEKISIKYFLLVEFNMILMHTTCAKTKPVLSGRLPLSDKPVLYFLLHCCPQVVIHWWWTINVEDSLLLIFFLTIHLHESSVFGNKNCGWLTTHTESVILHSSTNK